ncbi:glycoprotein-N-acetylgalactosamine 3-beta-galactosyltransferase 1-like isoform X2 [Ptychodera flava]|uniref:glycoprotein-N-acetylgalactosamine 3-beta-galactosyltransferase 1-like isoform X2 n=1 Tax=Ptychodera flava TaxID=63121 RepID=UPI00396A4FC1
MNYFTQGVFSRMTRKIPLFIVRLCIMILLVTFLNQVIVRPSAKYERGLNITGNVFHEKLIRQNETTTRGSLFDKVRILCIVTTWPKTMSRLQAVKQTWGKRCNKIVYVSSSASPERQVIGLNVTEGYEMLWGKTKAAFQYVRNHHSDDADWFLKADDDTYVILENLRTFLDAHDPQNLIYFGHRFHYPETNQSYMSGGAGYTLSKAGLVRLVDVGLSNDSLCQKGEKGIEDVLMGQCLERLGVQHGDSRDRSGRNRFLPLKLDKYFQEKLHRWLYDYEYYPAVSGNTLQCRRNLLTSWTPETRHSGRRG